MVGKHDTCAVRSEIHAVTACLMMEDETITLKGRNQPENRHIP